MSDEQESLIIDYFSAHKRDAKVRIVLQFAILGIVTLSSGLFWLYMDHHNDARYVSIPTYVQDAKRQKEDIRAINENLSAASVQRSTEHDILRDVQSDIKWMRNQSKP